MKQLGFADVFEVAIGADLCATQEAIDFMKEVPEQIPFMATSCCPAWSMMAKKLFPEQANCISMALTPMTLTARPVSYTHLNQEQEKRPGSLKPGQDLIIAGSIGLTGAALAARKGERTVRERFSRQYAECIFALDQRLLSQEEAAEIGRETGITDMEPVGEGGVMNCLWRILEAYGLGCSIAVSYTHLDVYKRPVQ